MLSLKAKLVVNVKNHPIFHLSPMRIHYQRHLRRKKDALLFLARTNYLIWTAKAEPFGFVVSCHAVGRRGGDHPKIPSSNTLANSGQLGRRDTLASLLRDVLKL